MKININNEEKVEVALAKQGGRIKAQISLWDVKRAIEQAEVDLEIVAAKYQKGTRVYIQGLDGVLPNSYRGAKGYTGCALEKGSKNWFLVGTWSGSQWGGRKQARVNGYEIVLTKKGELSAYKNMLSYHFGKHESLSMMAEANKKLQSLKSTT